MEPTPPARVPASGTDYAAIVRDDHAYADLSHRSPRAQPNDARDERDKGGYGDSQEEEHQIPIDGNLLCVGAERPFFPHVAVANYLGRNEIAGQDNNPEQNCRCTSETGAAGSRPRGLLLRGWRVVWLLVAELVV